MKTALRVFGSIIAAGLILIFAHRHFAEKDARAAVSAAHELATWDSDAAEQIKNLRSSSIRAAHDYSYESRDVALQSFGLLDMRISSAERILSGAPEGVDNGPLKAAINDARRCLSLAPVPPAASAAMSAK